MTQDELQAQLDAELARFCGLAPEEWCAMQRDPLCLSMWADQYTWEVGGMLNEWINSDLKPVNCANLSGFLTQQMVESGMYEGVNVTTCVENDDGGKVHVNIELVPDWGYVATVAGTTPQSVLLATLTAYNAWREWLKEQNNG